MRTGGETVNMTTIRVISSTWLLLLLVPLVIAGCQLGFGAKPTTPPLPPTPSKAATDHNSKIIDGYLHVRYIPCETTGAAYVAPIVLTDLRSESYILLNRNGTVKASRKPRDTPDAGKAALEAVLKDSALVKQIVARPACPDRVYRPNVQQKDGWPDAFTEDIGDPPMPKVAMGVSPTSVNTSPRIGYPGWRGAYCWPISGGGRECDDTADWEGFGGASALERGRMYIAVLGDDANPGTIRRVRVFPAQAKWSIRKMGRVLHVGAEAHRVVATSGETLEKFILPRLASGDYLLITDYESPLGEVEYGFKVAIGR